jgi:hypothetical protein
MRFTNLSGGPRGEQSGHVGPRIGGLAAEAQSQVSVSRPFETSVAPSVRFFTTSFRARRDQDAGGSLAATSHSALDKPDGFRQTRASTLPVNYLSVPVSQGTYATFECLKPPMPRQCRAAGCDSPTNSRYSVYCSRHQSRLRRQGDVAQEAISKAELKTYLKR